jgi:outer membrane protein
MSKGTIYICFVLLLTLVAGLYYMQFKNFKKIGYVTTLKAFEEFELKKELEVKYKNNQIAKQTYLDSLKLNVQTLAQKSNDLEPNKNNRIEELKKIYLLKENQFNQENEAVYQQYNEQIWKQLNQYIEDYGKENGYDYLLGTSGQGSIMYATEKDNLTEEIIKYINNKYVGKNNK